jgi:hypothetical protein
MSNLDAAKLQKLVDRQEILDCLTRYCRGVDRFDRELLLSAYHADATDDHGVFVGNPAQFADWVFNAHGTGQKRTNHVIANHTCEIDGDTAHAETYCVYFGWNRDDSIDVVGNRYIDRFERRRGEWRIADRICMVEWHGGLSTSTSPAVHASMAELMANAPNLRNKSDASYQRPLKIGRARKIPPPTPEV